MGRRKLADLEFEIHLKLKNLENKNDKYNKYCERRKFLIFFQPVLIMLLCQS